MQPCRTPTHFTLMNCSHHCCFSLHPPVPVQSFKSDAAITLNGKAIATGAASMQSTPAAMAGAELLTFSKSQPDATGPMTPAMPWVDSARPRANARCSRGAQRLSIEAKRLKNVAPPTATLQGSGVCSHTHPTIVKHRTVCHVSTSRKATELCQRTFG